MTDIFKEIVLDDNQDIDPVKYAAAKYGDGENVDLEKLAKSKYESDRHIKKLEAELAEMRQEITSKQTMDEIMTQIKALSTPKPPQDHGSPNQPPVQDEDKVNIEEVVSRLLSQKEQESQAAKNRRLIEDALVQEWGEDALINVNKKAKELGVSIEQLNRLTVESPQIVLNLLGLSGRKDTPAPVVAPRGRSSAPAEPLPTTRNKAYYDRLKATNPSEYFTPKIRNQMMKDAMALKEAFFTV